MYVTFKGRMVKVYDAIGQEIRRFSVRADVVQATVSGDVVSVVCSNGYTYLYRTTGEMFRQVRN